MLDGDDSLSGQTGRPALDETRNSLCFGWLEPTGAIRDRLLHCEVTQH
jgi:hypothetical protein